MPDSSMPANQKWMYVGFFLSDAFVDEIMMWGCRQGLGTFVSNVISCFDTVGMNERQHVQLCSRARLLMCYVPYCFLLRAFLECKYLRSKLIAKFATTTVSSIVLSSLDLIRVRFYRCNASYRVCVAAVEMCAQYAAV